MEDKTMFNRFKHRWSEIEPVSVFLLSLCLAFILTVAAIIITVNYLPAESLWNIPVILVVWLMAAGCSCALWFIWQKRVIQGVWVLNVSFWVGILGLSILTAGFGLALGLIAFLVPSAISVQVFPVKQINRVMAVGVIVGGAAFIQDIFGSSARLTFSDQQHYLIYIFAGIILPVFAVAFFWQFRKLSLLSKLILPIVMITISSVGALAAYNYQITRQALLDAKNEALRATAQQTASSISAYINAARTSLVTEARLPDLINYLSLPEEVRKGSHEEQNALSLLRSLQSKGYILSYSLLDTAGKVLLSTTVPPTQVDQLPQNLGIDQTDRGFLDMLLLTNVPYISPVIFPPDGNPSIYFATRVNNADGNAVGVLISQVHASNLQSIITESIAQSKKLKLFGAVAELLDENNLRLAQSQDPEALYKFVAPIDPNSYAGLVSTRRIPDVGLDQSATNYPSFLAGLINSTKMPFFTAQEAGTQGQLSSVAVVDIPEQKWKVAFLQPQNIFLEPVDKQTKTAILLSVGIAVLVSFAVAIVARFIVQPIVRLTDVARTVTTGDLSVQAPVKSQDEIGLLANAFNTMTSQLRQILGGLELRVSERTKELEIISDQMRYRANQLQTVSEVARAIATVQDIDHLLPLITQTISERFGYYHVGIFLLDSHREYAVLQAANSEGGQQMLAKGHRLKIGQVGIVGYVTDRGEPRIALDVGTDAVYFDNPDLPETRSEMALPLKIGGTVIGALDVQSKIASAFKDEDISLLTTLADQVGIAIENARLFGETQKALLEAQTAQREYLRSEWEKVSEQQNLKGFQYTYGRVTNLPQEEYELVWEELERQNINRNDVDEPSERWGIIEPNEFQDQPARVEDELVIPITLRGQAIGIIKLQDVDQTRAWDQEDISWIKSVADQIGLALENARLLEATQRRAEREFLVGQITTKLRATNDPQVILQTAVTELRKALHAQKAQVIIQSQSNPDRDSSGT
jgi:GAF domain-containing protein/HAMP domain-containing protein